MRELLRHPVMPGLLVSALGDGMSLVAVAWLAVRIAPPGQAGVWTGLAVAAYALPASIGAAVLSRFMRGLRAARLVAADATLRAVALGAVATLAVTGHLNPSLYVVLLAVSSLLHAWGSAGAYTLVAELLPEEQRVAGNALLSTFTQASIVVGPAIAGALTGLAGPGWVIGADALSFAVLAVAAWSVSARRVAATESAAGAWATIRARPRLLGLLVVTMAFFFLYGPVEVALPVHVAEDLHGSAGLLGLYWTVFGVGATAGALGAGLLARFPPRYVVVAIIVGWGAALVPLGLFDAIWPGMAGLAFGGLIWGPYTAISTALFQRGTPPAAISRVLAARAALTVPATSVGTALGGPLVSVLGAQAVLLLSGLVTVGLGVAVGVAVRGRLGGRFRGRHGCARSPLTARLGAPNELEE
ncbi:MFS transporter [Actinoplanes sp. L3-i22]|uniref:MFS transporter n=1 Tax=Actinoplanes sp. L3-i22 TaxID=2836373 RepID=UPI001C75BA62|nr:MFS transporter [Actinoplanes sp. L3-i22]BCY10449.1 putative MFS-type transporter y4rN [Actinoplanes sp. L3-i22]